MLRLGHYAARKIKSACFLSASCKLWCMQSENPCDFWKTEAIYLLCVSLSAILLAATFWKFTFRLLHIVSCSSLLTFLIAFSSIKHHDTLPFHLISLPSFSLNHTSLFGDTLSYPFKVLWHHTKPFSLAEATRLLWNRISRLSLIEGAEWSKRRPLLTMGKKHVAELRKCVDQENYLLHNLDV